MKIKNLWLLIFCNSIFILYALSYAISINNCILGISINLIVFIVPGIGWIGILREKIRDGIVLTFLIVCFSLAILTLGLVGQHILQIEPASFKLLIYLMIITNLGIFFSRHSRTVESLIGNRREFLLLLLVSFFIYGCLYWGTVSIPPFQDLDREHQGTAYGLLYDLKPYLTSDILPVNFYFHHPPLTNLYSAYGILFLNQTGEFKYYYDSAKIAEQALNSKPGADFFISLPAVDGQTLDARVINIDSNNFILKEMEGFKEKITEKLSRRELAEYISENDSEIFFKNPNLFGARMFNLFVSILIFWVFFKLILYLTNSKLLSLLAGFLYILSPGIFVRSCTSEHLAFTNYAAILLAYQYIVFDNRKISNNGLNLLMFSTAVFAALTNQKILILILAILLAEIIRGAKDGLNKTHLINKVINAPVAGYLLGMALFWTYGLLIDKNAFILSHVQVHFLDRIFHYQTVLFDEYASVWILWKEFHIEFPILLLSTLAVFSLLKYTKKREGLLILWALIGAISFSIVDWRQTNHLMCIVPPLVILAMIFIARQKRWCRRLLIFTVAACLSYSLWFNIKLINDFSFYEPKSHW